MEVYDVVKKLIGPISPVGETNTDERRYANLEATIDLVDRLVYDISSITCYKDNVEHSMKKAGKKANDYLQDLKDNL